MIQVNQYFKYLSIIQNEFLFKKALKYKNEFHS
jgi:hypothetical protein